MRFSQLAVLLLPAWACAYTEADYDSGKVHQMIMDRKHSSWEKHRSWGEYNSKKWKSFLKHHKDKDVIRCNSKGLAVVEPGNPAETFRCKNIDYYDFKSHADLGSFAGEGSSSWGWVAPNGREFVAIGQADGTAFAEINKDGKLVYLGRLPQQSVFSIWREIRSYKNYMVIGSEARGHGIQFFDMNKLLSIDPRNPKNFSITADVTGLFTDLPVGRTHNVVVNEELGYAVSVGAQPRNSTCRAGLIFIDVSDITKPVSPGCAGQDGYVHDAECLVYRGPDKRYYGRDICYGYNEDTLTIYDVTDKTGVNSSRIISRTPYVGASYSHQGAVLNRNWQEYLVLDDELDEEDRAGAAADQYPVTYIFDIRNLEKPVNTGHYKSKQKAIDHNQYVHDGLVYQSNYAAGLRVYDVSGIPTDPTGGNVEEVAYFDIYPEDDATDGLVDFVGTWSHYAGFPSGYIMINTIERGVFVVKMNKFAKKGHGKWWNKPRMSL
ncbi:hypothetical protein E4T48_06957 [Aureobasidium sp. EXF-10727]|nr:hypothetical protein E4T48_06957 [Aureobasidium sp. EXF-10727]